MRRFIRRGGPGRRPKEPTTWLREKVSQGNANMLGTTATITVADPTLLPAVAGTDVRMTLRRLILDVNMAFLISGGTAAVGDAYVIWLAAYLASPTESINPTPGTTATADFLWQSSVTVLLASAPPVTGLAGNAFTFNTKNQPNLCDIKAMRKLDSDEVIRLSAFFVSTDIINGGHAPATAQLSWQIGSSSLWSRTMKR